MPIVSNAFVAAGAALFLVPVDPALAPAATGCAAILSCLGGAAAMPGSGPAQRLVPAFFAALGGLAWAGSRCVGDPLWSQLAASGATGLGALTCLAIGPALACAAATPDPGVAAANSTAPGPAPAANDAGTGAAPDVALAA